MSNLILVEPLDGWSSALEEVPDPVFSGKLMGDGLVHRTLCFHAIHHSSLHLDWRACSRSHMVDTVANRLFAFLPIATPEFHHWHHTSDEEGIDKNFAVLLVLSTSCSALPTCRAAGRSITERRSFSRLRLILGSPRIRSDVKRKTRRTAEEQGLRIACR